MYFSQLKKIFLLFCLCFSINTRSAIFIEPYLGIGKSSVDLDDSESSGSGLGFGGRMAFMQYGVMAGGDLSFQSVETSEGTQTEYSQKQLAIYVGYALFQVPLRAWMGYNFMDFASTNLDRKYKGGGFKVGVGYDPYPNTSFNLEFKKSTYDEFKDSEGTANLNQDLNIVSLFLSVSFLLLSGPG
jgi:hypothetical protein